MSAPAPRSPLSRRRFGQVVLAASAGVVALAGCTPNGGPAASSPSPTSNAESTAAAAGEAGFPRTVRHFRGSTEIPARPTRVVALDNSFADAVLLLQTPLVGYVAYTSGTWPAYLGDAPQRYAADAVTVGVTGEPTLEAIAALQPDLIVSAEVRDGDRYDVLSAIAPTIFTEGTGVSWKENFTLLAQALGREDLAATQLGDYQARAAKIGAAIEKRDGDPTVSIVRFAGEATARLYRTTSFAGIVLADVGLTRPASQQADPADATSIMNPISPELITEAEADVIFVSTYGGAGGAASEAAEPFVTSALWRGLQGRKVEVDDAIWMTSVSVPGASGILDDLAAAFDVDAAG